jgi:hypothetical protein
MLTITPPMWLGTILRNKKIHIGMNILFKKQEYYNSKNKIVPIAIKKLIN